MHLPVAVNASVLVAIAIITIIITVWFCLQRSEKFYDRLSFPELEHIDASARSIRAEIAKFNPAQWTRWPEKELTDGNWKVVPLFAFGKWSSKYDQFPATVSALKKIPGLRTAGFSRLGPGTELKPHQGWAALSNGVLRCHYGLDVPDNCTITCGGETRTQKQNAWLIFDDSMIHSAANKSSSPRTVLLIDIERPWWVRPGCSNVETSRELEDFVAAM
jgi:beta-hydroxylase